jgi:hypothetical protein
MKTETRFRITVNAEATRGMIGQFLQGPRTRDQVKKVGYGFTNSADQAWTFPSKAQAEQKARIVCRHMSWNVGCTQAEVAQ